MTEKIVGTKNRVATVEISRPPITARPSGAFCSPPSPRPRLMGTMPIIIAMAVMMTGRSRVRPDSNAARKASPWCSICSRANETTRIEFAVATPMHMMAPISAGTLSGVPVRNSIHEMPASAPGRPVMMMKGSVQDWKLTTMSR